jgi:hypothetical protein
MPAHETVASIRNRVCGLRHGYGTGVKGNLLGSLSGDRHRWVVWLSIVLVSTLEPVVMRRLGFSAFDGLFLFGFNLLQLYVLRRYVFVAMFSLRLVYYMHWHIIWGFLQLRWLF